MENNPFCQTLLKKHWPDTPVYGDITTIDWKTMPEVDVLTGGFPCQDISIANREAKGISGARSGLWKYFFAAIRVLRPCYAVIENVPVLRIRGLDVVLRDFASIEYDAEWFPLRHCDVGGFTLRKRLFIVACPREFRPRRLFKEHIKEISDLAPPVSKRVMERRFHQLCQSVLLGAHPGIPLRVDRIKALGNCVIPQVAEVIAQAIKQTERERGKV